jgi:hypothetical protein
MNFYEEKIWQLLFGKAIFPLWEIGGLLAAIQIQSSFSCRKTCITLPKHAAYNIQWLSASRKMMLAYLENGTPTLGILP